MNQSNNQNHDFSSVDALKKKLDGKRPLDTVLHNKIMQKFHLDWTYNSNAIEGNTLNYSETQFYLNFGLTSKGHPLSEYLEMKNHKHALIYLEEIIREKKPLTERLIKDLHAMLFKNNDEVEIQDERGKKIKVPVLPGTYKKEDNYVLLPDNTIKKYVSPLKVVDEMEKLIKFYKDNQKKLHPILLATELHAHFVSIHPFVDGNGRTARLIMNIVLMQAGYSPAIIQNEKKQDYYDVLQSYDATGEVEGFVSIIEQEVTRTLQIMLNATEGKMIFRTEDIKKRIEHFSKTMDALDKDVGKFAKKVTREEKQENIKKVRDYLYKIAKEKIGDSSSSNFRFGIKYPNKISEIILNKELIASIDSKNIVLDIRKIKDGYDRWEWEDYLDNEDGSGFSVKLASKKGFIPNGYCSFVILPTKYTLCVGYTIAIKEMDSKEEDVLPTSKSNKSMNFIQNGVLWEDWNKQDLDNFFNEVFDQFLSMVQQEAERRRIRIEEKHEK